MSAPRGLLNSRAALPRLRVLACQPAPPTSAAAVSAASSASWSGSGVGSNARWLNTSREGSPKSLPPRWFSPSPSSSDLPPPDSLEKRNPGDDRKTKLGKTLRVLQERLPTLLQSPLPQDILAPNISLHLFPSTHPHLPKVSGRVAYVAALWSSPIAWNRVPIVGNVTLEILSERMSKEPVQFAAGRVGAVGEQLIVRWRTVGRSIPAFVPGESTDFTGLFIFEFDAEGRILSHTIEHVQEGGEWENGVGAKFVGLTHWLLGGIKGSGAPPLPVAFQSKDTTKT